MVQQKDLQFAALIIGMTAGLIKIYDYMGGYLKSQKLNKDGVKVSKSYNQQDEYDVNKDNKEELKVYLLRSNFDEEMILNGDIQYVKW